MKEKLEARKLEIEKEFNHLKAEQDQLVDQANKISQELLRLNGAYNEIERQIKELPEETPSEN